MDELENMFANRYSVNFGGNYDKAHLNELETVINLGERFLTPKNKETIRKEIEESNGQVGFAFSELIDVTKVKKGK